MTAIDFGTWGKSAFTRNCWLNKPRGASYGEYFFAARDAAIHKEGATSFVVYFGSNLIGSRSTLKDAKQLAVDKVDALKRASRQAAAKRAMAQLGREMSTPAFAEALGKVMDQPLDGEV